MIKLSRVFVIPKEYKRKYDFDKIKNLSLIAQIAQIFNTESTKIGFYVYRSVGI